MITVRMNGCLPAIETVALIGDASSPRTKAMVAHTIRKRNRLGSVCCVVVVYQEVLVTSVVMEAVVVAAGS